MPEYAGLGAAQLNSRASGLRVDGLVGVGGLHDVRPSLQEFQAYFAGVQAC